MGINVGLDIGVASVGWAVIDETGKILEAGSNIFPEADAAQNETRRSMRQTKRLHRREKTRIDDFKKLWGDKPQSVSTEVLGIRVKALNEEVSLEELFAVLLNDLKHRGISYLDDDADAQGSSDYAKGLDLNKQELKTKYPCEIQLERLKTIGAYRGYNKISDDITASNTFTTAAYRKEIEKTLQTQSQYHSEIDNDFIEKYLEIFGRKRAYYEGPGSEKSRTDYGRFTTKMNPDGEYITEENIFEKLIGKCSVYPDERRAAGASYTAQEFNLLNDLNNLTVNGRKLDKEEKEIIVSKILEKDTITVKAMHLIIKEAIGDDITSISGFAIDKDEKEVYNHTFKIFKKMRKEFNTQGLDINDISVEELDIISEILTLNTEKDAIEKSFEVNGVNLNDAVKDTLIAFRKANGSMFTKWQSNSIRLMKELIPEMYEQPKNQMELLTDMGVFEKKASKFEGYKYIPEDLIIEDIYNPVVKRSIRVSVKIVNAILKKYKEIDQIVIEMPRDKNSKEQKKKIQDMQNANEKELKTIIKKVKDEYGIEITDNHFKQHKKLVLKLKLWNEQQGTCPYSGKRIEIDDLLNNPSLFEVDHIIPLSISFDDSRNNKVLVYSSENQNKGNHTPYMYLNGIARAWNYERYRAFINTLNITRKKKSNFLFMGDINKQEVVQGFISRNITDTSYASRVVLNSMQGFFTGKDTKITVVKGAFTHQMRNYLQLEKDRDESYSHHAVDAMLIIYSKMGYDAFKQFKDKYIDVETGEIINIEEWEKLDPDKKYYEICYANKMMFMRDSIKEAEKHIKYWHKVDYKVNRQLCDQTIYGTREYDGKVQQISKLNIYTKDGYDKFKKMISKGKEDNILMFRNDPKTFENLMTIFHEYESEPNAFVAYEKETGDFVRKYSKNHNGCRIETLKYLNGEVNTCIDISHKYGHKKGSKKVVQLQLKPYRADVYYKKEDNTYRIIGLKYSDIKCQNGKYIIDEDRYTQILLDEKLINEGQKRYNLKDIGYDFMFSLYKNDIIEYTKINKDGTIELSKERFLSRTMPQVKNYIETKPVNASKFEKQKLIGVSGKIQKINTDILGNEYRVIKEEFSNICK